MVYCKSTKGLTWFTNISSYQLTSFALHTSLDGLLADLPTVLNILLANLKIGSVGLLTNRHTGLNGLVEIHKPVKMVYQLIYIPD